MADYVENYQTSVDTQSGQHWQRMQENIANTFGNLQNANITRIKENKEEDKKKKEEAKKEAKVIQDRNNRLQADELDYVTDLQAKFSKMDPIAFHNTFDPVIKTRAALRARMEAGEILSAEDRLKYSNAMNAPTLVKEALANQLAISQQYAEIIKKDPRGPNAYSKLNEGSATDKLAKAAIPVRDGENIQLNFELTNDFTGVNVDTLVGGKSTGPVLGANLAGAMGPNGNGAFLKVVNVPDHIDAVKRNSKLYYDDEKALKSGESSSLINSVRREHWDLKSGRMEKIPGEDGAYKMVYNIKPASLAIIKKEIEDEVKTLSTQELITWGADVLELNGLNRSTMTEWLSGDKRTELEAAITKNMVDAIPTTQEEMDQESPGVKKYPGPKKPNKTDSSGHSAGWKRKYNFAISQGLSDADAKAYANSK